MAYPSSIDNPGGISAQGTSTLVSPDHASDHRTLGSAVIAIENKLSLGAGSAAANQILVGSGVGTSSWGSVWNLAQLGSATIGTPAITGGTANNQVVGTPAITGGTLTLPQVKTHTLGSAAVTGTVSTTQNFDLSTATRFLLNMPNSAGSITLTVSNVTVNQPFVVEVLQGTAGLGTINWFSTIRWAGSAVPTQTLTASRKDTFGFIATGAATFDGYIVGANL